MCNRVRLVDISITTKQGLKRPWDAKQSRLDKGVEVVVQFGEGKKDSMRIFACVLPPRLSSFTPFCSHGFWTTFLLGHLSNWVCGRVATWGCSFALAGLEACRLASACCFARDCLPCRVASLAGLSGQQPCNFARVAVWQACWQWKIAPPTKKPNGEFLQSQTKPKMGTLKSSLPELSWPRTVQTPA